MLNFNCAVSGTSILSINGTVVYVCIASIVEVAWKLMRISSSVLYMDAIHMYQDIYYRGVGSSTLRPYSGGSARRTLFPLLRRG